MNPSGDNDSSSLDSSDSDVHSSSSSFSSELESALSSEPNLTKLWKQADLMDAKSGKFSLDSSSGSAAWKENSDSRRTGWLSKGLKGDRSGAFDETSSVPGADNER